MLIVAARRHGDLPAAVRRASDPRDVRPGQLQRQPPSAEHWFGFDQQGCDVYARTSSTAPAPRSSSASSRPSAVLVLGVAARRASPASTAAWTDASSSRITDIFFAHPADPRRRAGPRVVPARQQLARASATVVARAGAPRLDDGRPARARRRSSRSSRPTTSLAARALGAANRAASWSGTSSRTPSRRCIVVATIALGVLHRAPRRRCPTSASACSRRPSPGACRSPTAQTCIRTAPHLLLFPAIVPDPDRAGVHPAGRRRARRPRPEAALRGARAPDTSPSPAHGGHGTAPPARGRRPARRVPHPRRRRQAPSTASATRRPRARRSRSSASPAPASRVTAQAIMGILDMPARRRSPAARSASRARTCSTLPEEERRQIRGRGIAMIFQDALSSLNPVYSVGYQIGEMFRVHRGMSSKEAKQQGHRADGPGAHPGRRRSGSTTTRTSSPAACASAS